MEGLIDLEKVTPEEWDAAISSELASAGITPHKFREYNAPYSWVKHTLQGKLGGWVFSRDRTIYSFWGDVPLATVEAIAAEVVCLEGCMPGLWLPSWGNQPIAKEVHAHFTKKVVWIDVDGYFRVVDEGLSDELREVLQRDANHKLRFVAEPSADGKPFIQTYTFFTLDALKQFVKIAKRHRVDFKYTYKYRTIYTAPT